MTALLVLWIGYKLLKIPFGVVTGIVAAVHTQPAVQAYAVNQAKNDLPNHGYALAFPMATIAKILHCPAPGGVLAVVRASDQASIGAALCLSCVAAQSKTNLSHEGTKTQMPPRRSTSAKRIFFVALRVFVSS